MAVPTRSNMGSSELLRKLSNAGYESWLVFDTRSNADAFYQLLGQGVVDHFKYQYEVSPFLTGYYRSPPLESSAPSYSEVFTPAKFSSQASHNSANPEYWSQLADEVKHLLSLLIKQRFKEMIMIGTVLGDPPCLQAVTLALCVSLVFYEDTQNGILTKHVLHEGNRNPTVFVAMAKEIDTLYLLKHRKFDNFQGHSEFPFYTRQGEKCDDIPALGDLVGREESASNVESLTQCVRAQHDAIERLSELLVASYPSQFPPNFADHQKVIRTLTQSISSLLSASGLDLPPGQSLQHVINLPIEDSQASTQPAVPAVEHTIYNCELFIARSDSSALLHEHEVFCRDHLCQYLQTSNTDICPRCQKQLPDTVLKVAHPELYKTRIQKKQSFTMAYKAGSQQTQQYTIRPSSCSMLNGAHRGMCFTMTCGRVICTGCLSSSQLQGTNGFCPLCSNPLDQKELGYTNQGQSSIFYR